MAGEYINVSELKSHQRKEKAKAFLGKVSSAVKKYGGKAVDAGKKSSSSLMKSSERGNTNVKKSSGGFSQLSSLFSPPPVSKGKKGKSQTMNNPMGEFQGGWYDPFGGSQKRGGKKRPPRNEGFTGGFYNPF